MKQNYFSCYEFLGIEPNANAEEIEKAFKKKWLKYHPDRNDGSPLAKELFEQVTRAKNILLNPVSRLDHDYEIGVKERPMAQAIVMHVPQPAQQNGFGSLLVKGLAIYGAVKVISSLFGSDKSK